jgi:hypothetical protein
LYLSGIFHYYLLSYDNENWFDSLHKTHTINIFVVCYRFTGESALSGHVTHSFEMKGQPPNLKAFSLFLLGEHYVKRAGAKALQVNCHILEAD